MLMISDSFFTLPSLLCPLYTIKIINQNWSKPQIFHSSWFKNFDNFFDQHSQLSRTKFFKKSSFFSLSWIFLNQLDWTPQFRSAVGWTECKLHGLSPPGGLMSPRGKFVSLLCDQGLHFASIKLCQVFLGCDTVSVVRRRYLCCFTPQ